MRKEKERTMNYFKIIFDQHIYRNFMDPYSQSFYMSQIVGCILKEQLNGLGAQIHSAHSEHWNGRN